jgi:hypothetical protein
MSQYYNNGLPLHGFAHHPQQSHPHRSRRARQAAPHLANHHNQFRGALSIKEMVETPQMMAFRARFEAAVSFDLDDDLEFCPALLTDEDIASIHSSPSSDRSSLSSLSPEHSPIQQQIQPLPQVSSFSLSAQNSFVHHSYQPSPSPSASFNPSANSYFSPSSPMKNNGLNAANARSRNAIPIVDPSTGMRMPSPPTSISPARIPQSLGRHRW